MQRKIQPEKSKTKDKEGKTKDPKREHEPGATAQSQKPKAKPNGEARAPERPPQQEQDSPKPKAKPNHRGGGKEGVSHQVFNETCDGRRHVRRRSSCCDMVGAVHCSDRPAVAAVLRHLQGQRDADAVYGSVADAISR